MGCYKTFESGFIITNNTYPTITDNELLNLLRASFIRTHNNATAEDIQLAEYISSEFCKVVSDSKDYLISATIATDVVNGMEKDGIIYPSAQLDGQAGLNIALTPKSVNKKLKFVRTLEQTIYKNGTQSFIRLERVTERDGATIKINNIPIAYIEEHLGVRINNLPIA